MYIIKGNPLTHGPFGSPVPLLPSKVGHTLSVECISPWINLLSLYHGSLLNSFLRRAKNPRLAAVPGTRMWPGIWPSSCTPCSVLPYHLHCFQPCSLKPLPALSILFLFNLCQFHRPLWDLRIILIYISLITSEIKHILLCLLAIFTSFMDCFLYYCPLPIFQLG